MSNWTRSDCLQLTGIFVFIVIAFGVYLLERRLTDKQRVDHRLEIEDKINQNLYDIHNKSHSSKIQLYNSRLLNKKRFSLNKRSRIYGYPYHGAGLYSSPRKPRTLVRGG